MTAKEIITAIVTAIFTAIGVVGAASFGYFNKDRELDIEMVRVSLNILSGEAKDTSVPGRRFALRTLEKYSGVEIPVEELKEWAERGTIPTGAWASASCTALVSRYIETTRTLDYISLTDELNDMMSALGCTSPIKKKP
ncbi:hypothetical protein G6L90_06740 [Agrobacterium tumefaciens]|uniref:hypothetical protein n=1 Tax=Agrobacterium tumefaciens TaxID=358 RepID=UPI00157214D7|nr:hypothetical protein [Agrobacterium tumefaciens]WHO22653.1 hypothetical protein G6L90_06740 [Agrobacterium tumefaciens]